MKRRIREVESAGRSDMPNSAGYEKKYLHEISLRSGKTISLVERAFDDRLGIADPDKYIKRWQAFKDAGLPVVRFIRRSEKGIFMKNLKHDGSEIFGKGYLTIIEDQEDNSRGKIPLLTEMENKFIRIMETDLPKIRLNLDDIVRKAKDNDLLLPSDDPFELLIHPNGTWEIIILDLSYARIDNDTHFNGPLVTNALEQLIELKDHLLARPKP
ncbi:hypothetical protein A3D42_03285 [Candidatus Nomurabacteria bacterium RIFCSPHIGHO2_02_FULL_41_18]|uniref:Uncharacterized protein n=1 Tax=Candidatus Nomurabacteria bacterium RIFCSPHIGHO2_02_FULL_41_18 TaxID=1801754 RepID=A0A1F6W7Y6_9BACT|nr:MAG: hypothetical protein A2737_01375 [Candidatus Nomurabacteria bacterium RIFCSPHIGHO2_01_FULL_41_71]OGI78057.1 MAG: hypothetical protein A3D42_03285 [Candidatus Nomurabacteria bacterium RIFCSPHIGHO2_02_FULL_41_18]OGJ00206.1 MAG: hypothetical protein A3I90_01935 [Candidatus Nomurabacteria bacterium RIFCSPLOWO2_02_FULL_41_9]